MANIQHLLRKSAIEKMSSPEQLDMAMRVTSPVSWIALCTLGAIVLGVVLFGIFGSITERVDGSGILLRGDVKTIQVTADAEVLSIRVEEGDLVERGQIVAELELPGVESDIRLTRGRIRQLEGTTDDQDLERADLIASHQRQIGQLQARRRRMEQLVAQKLRTPNDLAAIDAEIQAIRSQIYQLRLQESGSDTQIGEEQRKLAELEQTLRDNATIRSPYRGQVAAILRTEGQLIAAGERLMNLENPDAPVEALLFVPFAEGKKVTAGMDIRIAPSTVKPEEHGFMLGEVQSVSSQAITPEEVRRILQNDQLAATFAQDTPFRVTARPQLDSTTPSGFLWTSSSGPPNLLAANTPCSAQIITGKRRPISYVIPVMKRAVGISS